MQFMVRRPLFNNLYIVRYCKYKGEELQKKYYQNQNMFSLSLPRKFF